MASSELLDGDLDKWSWDATRGRMVRSEDAMPDEIAHLAEPVSEAFSRDEFDGMIGPDRLAWGIAELSVMFRNGCGIDQVAINKDDPRFQKAVGVTYDYIMESPIGAKLLAMPIDKLLGIGALASFIVPYGFGVAKGVKDKKKAAQVQEMEAQKGADYAA